MQLFNERDVEYFAWQKYGSPERFEFHVKTLEARWKKKNPKVPFPQPSQYRQPSPGGSVVLPSANALVDPAIRTPTLLRLKQVFPDWLWSACDSALLSSDPIPEYRFSAQDREKALSAVHGALSPYPPRTPQKKTRSSVSVSALRLVLSDAPISPAASTIDHPEGGRPTRYLHEARDGPRGEPRFSWATEYRESVFAALIDVINEHGLGDDGWKSVRWEVYDKYAEYISGISYDNDRWSDGAAGWLAGRLAPEELGKDGLRGDCESGRTYNGLLPGDETL
jgi:hypothetical protein